MINLCKGTVTRLTQERISNYYYHTCITFFFIFLSLFIARASSVARVSAARGDLKFAAPHYYPLATPLARAVILTTFWAYRYSLLLLCSKSLHLSKRIYVIKQNFGHDVRNVECKCNTKERI